MVEEFGELFAEERADDGWGRLIATQAMRIRGTDNRGLQQSIVAIDSHERLHDKRDETQILFRCLTGRMEEDRPFLLGGRQTPVVVLARTIDPVERLFVEQHTETVVTGHALHQ